MVVREAKQRTIGCGGAQLRLLRIAESRVPKLAAKPDMPLPSLNSSPQFQRHLFHFAGERVGRRVVVADWRAEIIADIECLWKSAKPGKTSLA
jgi:hypothetical protein